MNPVRARGASAAKTARRRSSVRRLRVVALGLFLLIAGTYTYLQAPALWFVRVPPSAIPSPDGADGERLLVIAPHPDDDILAAGGAMAMAAQDGHSVLVVFLTSGDANRAGARLLTMVPFPSPSSFRALGGRREKEVVVALRRLGVPDGAAIFLNYPDRGIAPLIAQHWAPTSPYRSRMTNMNASYSEGAYRKGTLYCGENLLNDLVEIVAAYRPTVVYVPHPLDAHADHKAGYYFAALSVQTVRDIDPSAAPPIVRCYMTHSEARPWPYPRSRSLGVLQEILPVHVGDDPWESLKLTAEAVFLKLSALRAHLSQWWTCGSFLRSFVRENELTMLVAVGAASEVSGRPFGLVDETRYPVIAPSPASEGDARATL